MVSVPASSMGSADLGKAPSHMHLKLKRDMNVVNAAVFSVKSCDSLISYGSIVLYTREKLDVSIQKRATIGPPVKRHWNGVSLVGRWWPEMTPRLGVYLVL